MILTSICFYPIVLCDYFDQNFLIPKQLVFQVSVLVIFILWTCKYKYIPIYHRGFLTKSVLLFFLWTAICSFVSPNPFIALNKYTFWLSGVLFILLLEALSLRGSTLFLMWIVVMFVVVSVSYMQWLGFSPVPVIRSYFYGSTLGNPNFVACLSATTAISLLGYAFSSHGRQKILWIVLILFFIFPVFFIGARGVFVGLLVAVSIFCFLRKAYLATITLLLLFFLASLLPFYQGRSMLNKENFNQYGATKERVVVWVSSWKTFQQNLLFGTGFEQWHEQAWYYKNRFVSKNGNEIYRQAKKRIFTHTHNDYLEIFVETGVVGGCLFIVLLLAMLYYAYKSYQVTSCYKKAGHLAALSVLLTHALVSFPLQTTFGYVCFLLNWFFSLNAPMEKNIERQSLATCLVLLLLLCNTVSWAFAHLI
ncbi:O-antigen ligase family protein [Candidatus Uabimicrobium sp. HlEnr_7]|uniref:O-antigen ligase family protein n=1 Tax=Candidatus Uabimicrobium helgolandensis TaxID=3095367 RepID=UPI003558CFB4